MSVLSKPNIDDKVDLSVKDYFLNIWNLLIGDISTVLVFGAGHVIPDRLSPVNNQNSFVSPSDLTVFYHGEIQLNLSPDTKLKKMELSGYTNTGTGNKIRARLISQDDTSSQTIIATAAINNTDTEDNIVFSHTTVDTLSYKIRISAKAASNILDAKMYRIKLFIDAPMLPYEVEL